MSNSKKSPKTTKPPNTQNTLQRPNNQTVNQNSLNYQNPKTQSNTPKISAFQFRTATNTTKRHNQTQANNVKA